MQRLFSMFPRGLPGFALLLLRVSLACAVLLNVYGRPGELSIWLLAISLLLAATLFIGVLTPIAALLALVAILAIPLGGHINLQGAGYIAIESSNALALCLLGPGAYSLDALCFGRRVISLTPPDDRKPG